MTENNLLEAVVALVTAIAAYLWGHRKGRSFKP